MVNASINTFVSPVIQPDAAAPRFTVCGIQLGTLLSMEQGRVIAAVPEEERKNFRYWRAVHLGKIALNLLRGRMRMNAGEEDQLIHFSGNYADGQRIAAGQMSAQWTEADARRFAELTKVSAPTHFAAAVIAAKYVGDWQSATRGPGWGYSVEVPVGFHEIDPYSLHALEELFEVDLLQPPASPGECFLHVPAPARDTATAANVQPIDHYYPPGRRPWGK